MADRSLEFPHQRVFARKLADDRLLFSALSWSARIAYLHPFTWLSWGQRFLISMTLACFLRLSTCGGKPEGVMLFMNSKGYRCSFTRTLSLLLYSLYSWEFADHDIIDFIYCTVGGTDDSPWASLHSPSQLPGGDHTIPGTSQPLWSFGCSWPIAALRTQSLPTGPRHTATLDGDFSWCWNCPPWLAVGRSRNPVLRVCNCQLSSGPVASHLFPLETAAQWLSPGSSGATSDLAGKCTYGSVHQWASVSYQHAEWCWHPLRTQFQWLPWTIVCMSYLHVTLSAVG